MTKHIVIATHGSKGKTTGYAVMDPNGKPVRVFVGRQFASLQQAKSAAIKECTARDNAAN